MLLALVYIPKHSSHAHSYMCTLYNVPTQPKVLKQVHQYMCWLQVLSADVVKLLLLCMLNLELFAVPHVLYDTYHLLPGSGSQAFHSVWLWTCVPHGVHPANTRWIGKYIHRCSTHAQDRGWVHCLDSAECANEWVICSPSLFPPFLPCTEYNVQNMYCVICRPHVRRRGQKSQAAK